MISIRLTEEEKNDLEILKRTTGLTTTQLGRTALFQTGNTDTMNNMKYLQIIARISTYLNFLSRTVEGEDLMFIREIERCMILLWRFLN